MATYRRILMPTRGGASSHPNQDRVIALAKDQHASLLFLYITDISFLDRLASPVLVDIEQELDELGAFVLALAQERARGAGVEAGTLVKRGDFRAVLAEVIEERGIDLVVFGSPVEATGSTTEEYLRSLADGLGASHGVSSLLLQGGEVVYRHSPG
jgi:nucleotide-binding universal stress UspA family protein